MSNESRSDPFAAFRRRQPRDVAPATTAAATTAAATTAPIEPAPRPASLSSSDCAQLDEQRYQADKLAGRGYDVDCTAPSHSEWAERNGHVREAAESVKPSSPAEIIATCKRLGVGLRLDDGTLVVKSNGKASASLIGAIEANADEVAGLLIEPKGREHEAKS